MAKQIVETTINGIQFSLETGRIAKQAHGSAIARMGDTMVIATACQGGVKEGGDFFPLTVEYVAKTYAAGKIPGGFFRREGKPTEKEILSARLIDRPIRPLFPEGYYHEVQLINTVISADDKNDADVLGITASSLALALSHMPFSDPVAGVRVGMVDGEFKAFPTLDETESGGLDLVVAGTANSIMMVEGGCHELSEDKLVDAIVFAHEQIKALVILQNEILAKCEIPAKEFTAPVADDPKYLEAVKEYVGTRLHEISFNGHKKVRYGGIDKLCAETVEALKEKFADDEGAAGYLSKAFHALEYSDMRETILRDRTRIGGRALDQVRPITIELDILPRAHGSALFTRGETQGLVVTTLGTKQDSQRVDNIQGEYEKTYMLHYNFPPYSVGECKRIGVTGRREIGHGHLAERALSPVLPSERSFPYTIRVVSEIMESNGSSSMASVCGGSLSLMSAGVPVKSPVAGVAMGLIKEGDTIAILTDILGTEDHLGDMDFKVCGTRDGITAIQMDIKIHGITPDLMRQALRQAHEARLHILGKMDETLAKSRTDLSQYAPRILALSVDREKIGEIIGPGGRNIRAMQEETGTTINIEDDGTVRVYGSNKQQAEAAVRRIQMMVKDPEIGEVFDGKVKTIVDFGAFIEFLPGRDGLVHISEIAHRRINRVDEVLKVGDVVKVELVGFERGGKVRLSMKSLIPQNDPLAAPQTAPAHVQDEQQQDQE